MAGFVIYFVAGAGFLALGLFEALAPALSASVLRLRFFSALLLSSLSFLYSLFSLSSDAGDPLAPALPLSYLAVAALFLLYSIAGLVSLPSFPISSFSSFPQFPSSLLDLLLLFSFFQEFLLFYLRRKDVDGIENRYFDLLLVPILVCAASTVLAAGCPRSLPPRLARAVGLVLQGTWFLQMGFSFFTDVIAHGCSLHLRSRVNFTIKCKTHQDYHRGRAIATLQFNCHLAFLVLVGVGLYGVMVSRLGAPEIGTRTGLGYRPLGKQLQMTNLPMSNFTLDTEEGINATGQQRDQVLPATQGNGISSSH